MHLIIIYLEHIKNVKEPMLKLSKQKQTGIFFFKKISKKPESLNVITHKENVKQNQNEIPLHTN